MRCTEMAGVLIGILLLGAAPCADAAPAKSVLRLSDGGVPVAHGAEVAYSLVLRPAGYSGYALQVGGGPLVNEAKLDGFTANEGAGGQAGGWLVDGTIEAIALTSSGTATITATGEAIANNELEPPPPPPPPSLARASIPKWECFYPLPKKLKGKFSTTGVAVVTGTTKAKPSKLCHLPGFSVSFTLELVPNGQSGPPLETSLVQ
jgi:hypothetical protein